jgi:hypothetical protein
MNFCNINQIDNNNKVAIFDVDNTLTIYETDKIKCPNAIRDVQPVWPNGSSGTTQTIIDVLRECDKNGYHIAIATRETGNIAYSEQQQKFFHSLGQKAGLHRNASIYLNSIFGTREWLDTPLFQNSCTILGFNRYNYTKTVYCRERPCVFAVSKQPSFINILNYLNIPPTRYNQCIVFDDGIQNLNDARALGLKTCQASLSCGGTECAGGCGLEPNAITLLRNLY